VTLGTMHLVSLPSHNMLWREVANSGHIPLFGLLSLVILRLSTVFFESRFKRWYAHYFIALIAIAAIGLLSEILQMGGPRDADLFDLLRDVAGAIVFLLLVSTVPCRILPWTLVDWSQKTRILLRLVALILLLGSVSPLFFWSTVFYDRSQRFPVICGFDSVWEMALVGTESGRIESVDPPPGWTVNPSQDQRKNRVGKQTYFPGKYSGLDIKEPYPDFSGYETLVFDLFNEYDSTLNLVVRIDDRHHNTQFDDRFNLRILIRPGMNRIKIPCSKIQFAPISREMDMKAIARILIFAVRPVEPFSIFVDNISLQ